jgi:hypothetical protein
MHEIEMNYCHFTSPALHEEKMAATMLAMGSFNDYKTQNLIVHSHTAPAFYASGPIKRAF